MFYYSIFDLNDMFLLLNLHLQSREICFVIVLASFLFVVMFNALTFMPSVSFGTRIFGDKTLQLPVHLF